MKTTINKISKVLMALSLLVFMFGVYIPIVNAEEINEQAVNNSEELNNNIENNEEQQSVANQNNEDQQPVVDQNNESDNNISINNVLTSPSSNNISEGKAKIGDNYYSSLADAIASITDGTDTTIEILADDLNASGIIIPEGRNITIDFGGHTYNVTGNYAGSSGTETQAFQLLKNSNIVMKNGTLKVSGANGKMIIQNYSNLTLTDMVIDGKDNSNVLYSLSNNNGNVLINGNTSIYAAEGRVAFDVCGYANYAGAHVTVDTTGTISGTIELSEQDKISLVINNVNHIGNFNVTDESLKDNLTITGGTFSTPMVAIGSNYYLSLADAVATVTDDTATTITVLADNLDASGVIIPEGRNITIDFGGHTYMVTHDYAGSTNTKTQAFQLLKNSNIVMKNGKVKVSGASGKMIIQNYSNLTLTDMVIDGGDNSNVLYALSNNNGNVLINGNTSISAAEGRVAFDVYGSSSYPDGAHVTVDTTGTISGTIELDGLDRSTLEIKNINHEGTFNITNDNLKDNLTVTGGNFSTPMVVIGDNYYSSLADAIASVTDGTATTIKVLADDLNASGIIIPEGRNITIDFGGHTYNVTGNYAGSSGTKTQAFQLLKNSNIVMKNGTLKVSGADGKMIIQNYSNLTLTDMVIDGRDNSNILYSLSNNNGNVLINGNTSIYAAEGRVAFDVCGFANYAGAHVTVDTTGIISGTIELSEQDKISLVINNIKHIGNISVTNDKLKDDLTINGGLYTSDLDSSWLGEEVGLVSVNNTYEAKKLLVANLSVKEENDKQYLYENNNKVKYSGSIYINSLGKRVIFVDGVVDTTVNEIRDFEDLNVLIKFKDGMTDKEFNGLHEFGDKTYLFENGVAYKSFNGSKFIYSVGKRYVFKNGAVDTTVNEVREFNDLNVLVKFKDGATDKNFNGLLEFGDKTYLFENGVADRTFNGSKFIYSVGKRFIFKNGAIDTTVNEIREFNDLNALVKFKDGATDKNFNGLLDFDGKTYLFENGVADKTFNGSKFVYSVGKRFIFKNGAIDTTVNEIREFNDLNALVKFKDGATDKSFNGLLDFDGKTYLFENGVADKTFNGSKFVYSVGKRFIFKNGAIDTTVNEIREFNDLNALVKFKDGATDKSFNGLLEFDGKTYLFDKGVADRTFNGSKFIYSEGKRFIFKNGAIDTNFSGIIEISDISALIMFKGGMTDREYNGNTFYNNNFYYFVDGVCYI